MLPELKYILQSAAQDARNALHQARTKLATAAKWRDLGHHASELGTCRLSEARRGDGDIYHLVTVDIGDSAYWIGVVAGSCPTQDTLGGLHCSKYHTEAPPDDISFRDAQQHVNDHNAR